MDKRMFGNDVPLYNQNVALTGGLNLGNVTIKHEADFKSWFKLFALLILVWFGAKVFLEFMKYFLSK
jgi:hypothetical protein